MQSSFCEVETDCSNPRILCRDVTRFSSSCLLCVHHPRSPGFLLTTLCFSPSDGERFSQAMHIPVLTLRANCSLMLMALKSALSSPYVPIRERLYFARNTRSKTPRAVLGTTYIYIKLMHLSVEDVCFGNDFIFRLHQVFVDGK